MARPIANAEDGEGQALMPRPEVDTSEMRRRAAEDALHSEPEQVAWHELDAVEDEFGVEQRQERWREIRRAAERELESGDRAWKAIESSYGFVWEYARFRAMRDALAAEWGRGATELLLVDTITQAFLLQERWMGWPTCEHARTAGRRTGSWRRSGSWRRRA
jgi:hypothetical protein